jgi:hypothetical protein
MTTLTKCFDENILNNLTEKIYHNFDCINIILEFAGYKCRNGKYMKHLEQDDHRIALLNSMPKICRIPSSNNNKPHFRVVIHKPRLNIPYVHVISTSIYFDTVHWHLDLGIVKYDEDGTEIISTKFDIHKYIYRKHTKENRPCNSIFFKKRLGI